jgi:hypothetical protein
LQVGLPEGAQDTATKAMMTRLTPRSYTEKEKVTMVLLSGEDRHPQDPETSE